MGVKNSPAGGKKRKEKEKEKRKKQCAQVLNGTEKNTQLKNVLVKESQHWPRLQQARREEEGKKRTKNRTWTRYSSGLEATAGLAGAQLMCGFRLVVRTGSGVASTVPRQMAATAHTQTDINMQASQRLIASFFLVAVLFLFFPLRPSNGRRFDTGRRAAGAVL